MRRHLQDWRMWLLVTVAGVMVAILIRPHGWRERPGYPLVAVLDITRSMNTRDVILGGRKVDRLSFAKDRLRRLLRQLPCGSTLGLGLFTERRSTLLMLPVEVCRHYYELSRVIDRIDWRMAWAADSRIAKGLHDAMGLLQYPELKGTGLLFITDGHEAPPVNPRYRTRFDDVKGQVKGFLVGVGGDTPTPMPKYDESGKPQGFYRPEDVPHRSTFGEPLKAPTDQPGFHPRNAPFGGEWVLGQEHLSFLHADYLRQLGEEAGLGFHRLRTVAELLAAIDRLGVQRLTTQPWDWRPWLAALALLLLTGLYGLVCWQERRTPLAKPGFYSTDNKEK
ncbi:mxaL protein [Methylomarinovum caldicuralii]|uniref:MxaL protein n=2 Tax=Methylomarinovum caldicuralii TaxID=438856 RepID=A0AAU9C278_9GAMM|nr:mxaL protein [Methylomarinovum caldicuralii]